MINNLPFVHDKHYSIMQDISPIQQMMGDYNDYFFGFLHGNGYTITIEGEDDMYSF